MGPQQNKPLVERVVVVGRVAALVGQLPVAGVVTIIRLVIQHHLQVRRAQEPDQPVEPLVEQVVDVGHLVVVASRPHHPWVRR